MSAMSQVETEHGVAGLERCQINRGVGLRTAMRLHVGKLGAEELLCTIDGKLLDDIDVLATAVVTLSRIAFGIFIGEHATGGLHHSRACVAFARNHLEAVGLALD